MSDFSILIIGAMLFIAYANGANDNFKGVATLFGSGTADYRQALGWATITTLAGSITAVFLAARLISIFQGTGLLPPSLAQSEPFLTAVILGAAVTVFLATKTGLPISTTHGLTGALFGGGLIAAGLDLGFHTLVSSFFLPLLVSPALAVILALLAFPLFLKALRVAGLNNESCVCIGSQVIPASLTPEGCVMGNSSTTLRVLVDTEAACAQNPSARLLGVNARKLLNAGHFLSAGTVSFARGLNDTPKIVALGLVVSPLDLTWCIGLVAPVIALGGLISAKKVAHTVSKRITGMEADEGFLANLVTSFLVILASRWGFPVSTTHVSCGALFGIGIANGQARWPVIRVILLAWVLTLPLAATSTGLIFAFLSRLTPA